MKKTAMLLIITAGLVSCAEDDDLDTATPQGKAIIQNTVYAKGGEEPKDTVTIPPAVQNTDGDPPPKDNGMGTHRPAQN